LRSCTCELGNIALELMDSNFLRTEELPLLLDVFAELLVLRFLGLRVFARVQILRKIEAGKPLVHLADRERGNQGLLG
jgi:hypothetical protein